MLLLAFLHSGEVLDLLFLLKYLFLLFGPLLQVERADIEVDLRLLEHFLERLGTLLTRHAGVSSVSTSNYGPDPERGF